MTKRKGKRSARANERKRAQKKTQATSASEHGQPQQRADTAAPSKRPPKKARSSGSTPRATTSPLVWVAVGLSVAGLFLTAYLTLTKWFGQHAAYCGAGSDCDLVQDSRWSTLLGLPIAFWGFLLYAALLVYVWRLRRRPSAWVRAVSIAAFGFGLSVYLTAISVFVIQAVCVYCLSSFALITAMLGVLIAARPATLQGFRWSPWAASTVGATAVMITVMHLHYSGVFDPSAGPEQPFLKNLASHLEATGAEFYGASWCVRCEDQKSMFEASAHRLPYVECSPDGRRGLQALACVTRNIERYPTWIIEGQRHEGLLTPQALARLSDFRWQDAQ